MTPATLLVKTFPTDYPFKPPAISIITPNGRFSTNTRLCLSMSDYHPDTWNPAWSVATILTGLLSFMTGDESTTGSIQTTDAVKKKLAADSKRWNNQENPRFTRLFSDLVAQNRTDIAKAEEEKLKLLNEQNERKKNDGTNVEIDLSKLDPEERARLANAASNTERSCIIM
ncbi:Ubiquitin-conjugating enzyme E2 6 [Candida tropicalis]